MSETEKKQTINEAKKEIAELEKRIKELKEYISKAEKNGNAKYSIDSWKDRINDHTYKIGQINSFIRELT
jgi:chromosome segregation ATPase